MVYMVKLAELRNASIAFSGVRAVSGLCVVGPSSINFFFKLKAVADRIRTGSQIR
jgi:hypothetical protein